MSQSLDPKSWEASEICLTTQRLISKVNDIKGYLPPHNLHRTLDPIIYQVSDLTCRSRDQFKYIGRLEEENGVLRKAKRATFELLKLEKEREKCRIVLETAEMKGYGEKNVQEAHVRFQVCKSEVVRARTEAENAKEALLEWIKKEAECRI
ncbi:hypothetical protein EG328_010954 [Venturia inaequalis]|uniref:Uncharacterized protein n=1 Tax=Venturia inaequalis TaxID=5025 RepID=A0A8H3U6F1_VENIN|nr:hypothetical protein EG328_010954 [Venturia inaequalis]RDI79421.1 hypothetical protein Vi05172_g10650 [Venturia inaequalis]